MKRNSHEKDIERFLSKVEKEDHGYESLCWQWKAGGVSSGYGHFGAFDQKEGKYKMFRAHKWIYEQLVGPMPKELELDHKCRNKRCCNPEHLEPVTHRENSARGLQGVLKPGKTSQYRGVSWDKQMSKWITKIKLNGKQYNLGYYDTEKEGHQAYFSALEQYEKDGTAPSPRKQPKTSRYAGVSFDNGRNKWVAGARIAGKRVAFGRFDTEEEAYQAYLKATQ